MSDAAIEAAIASFTENPGSMDALGNTVVSLEPVSDPVDTSTQDDATALSEAAPNEGGTADPVVPVTAPDPAAAAPEQSEIEKLLEAEGIQKQSIRGENRIPYSRTVKIIENAQAKWKADYDKTVATEREQFTQAQGRLESYSRQEQLASEDPDRYISLLASLDPRYQKFLGSVGKTADAAPAPPVADSDPEPQPLLDENKQPYYTPELWKQHQAWTRRQAVREAEAHIEQKYGSTLKSVQQEREAKAAIEARRPVVAAQMQRIISTYGEELVNKHQNDIIAAMKKDNLSAAEAAAMVLTPKLRQDEAALRSSILAELNRRPAAAAGNTVPSQTKPVVASENMTLEDKMMAEINRVMPRR